MKRNSGDVTDVGNQREQHSLSDADALQGFGLCAIPVSSSRAGFTRGVLPVRADSG